MANDMIAGLDVGSSKIRVVVGQPIPDEEGNGELHIIGAVDVDSSGIHRGSISSMEDAVSSISSALEKAERMTGMALNSAWVSIAGQHILVQESKGVIGVARTEGDIREEDVERVIDAARTVATPSNYEILHVVPKSFTVDGQHGVKDPVGMHGIRLEVEALIIQTLISHIKNLTKSIYRTGLDIDDLVFSPLSVADAVLTTRQRELGVCVVDIGASTTTIAIYEEADILHTAVFPIGGDHITNDIAIGLRTSLDVAERVKTQIGNADPEQADDKAKHLLADFGSQEQEVFKEKFIAEVINARMEEIFEAVDDELRKIDRSGMLPVGVVLTGSTMKMPGVVDVAKRVLRLPARIGEVAGISSAVDEVHDPGFSTAVGLVVWGESVQSSKKGFSMKLPSFKWVNKLATFIKKLIKKLIP